MQELRTHRRIAYQGQVLINNMIKAPCVSLSEGGLFVGTSYHLPLHSNPILEFPLNRDVIKTGADVRHVRKEIGMGLSFLDMNDAARGIIRKYIEIRSGGEILAGSPHILHLDPDPLKRRLYKSKLVADGYTVFEAADGAEALGILRERAINLIVMELYLKDVEGLALLQQLQQTPEWEHIPVIVLASKNILYDIKRAKDYGAKDFMIKLSTSPVLLAGAIKKYLPPTLQ